VSSTWFEHPSVHPKEDFIHDRPFTTCLSRRAQPGRRTSFGRRVWFTESHIVLANFYFTCWFIYSWYKRRAVIQSNNYTIFQ